jgi:EAL domain-containing protein (putative c-di-GMP-specific phosphodiesterase class I)
VGLLLLDAASFGGLERTYGAAAYQNVLSKLGALIRETSEGRLRAEDYVARGPTGQAEILVFLIRPPSEASTLPDELGGLARTILDNLVRHGGRIAYPYVKAAPPVHLGMTVALRNPSLGVETQIRASLDEARRDSALNEQIGARSRRQRFIEVLLRGEISSVFEPIVEVGSMTVHGYEALSRGPEGTDLHSPLAMFRTADEEDLAVQLDCLCRRKALEGAVGLPGGTKLFLNIRPTAIHDPSFKADALCRTLEASQLSPQDLVFEISEQESITNFDIFREVRDSYRKLGFQIALDDTGAGYASLEAVMELSPDYIKVDRAFVSRVDEDPARQELLRALHTVAGRIGSQIIAEGLDTLEELSTLETLGIPFGQGWLFGKPTPLRASDS